MAGAGYRTFSAGEVLTAGNVQTYLMDQAIPVLGMRQSLPLRRASTVSSRTRMRFSITLGVRGLRLAVPVAAVLKLTFYSWEHNKWQHHINHLVSWI